MIPLWRLTRNRYGRRLYEALGAVGVTATRMIEFEADETAVRAAMRAVGRGDGSRSESSTESVPGSGQESNSDPGPSGEDVSVVAVQAGDAGFRAYDVDFSIPVTPLDGEWVVVAEADEGAVGRALVSAGQHPYVKPLGTDLAFDGAYVRRVFVHPARRNEGLATRLVREAVAVAGSELDATTAHALVAADNVPSQRTFEKIGFRPVRRHDYVRLVGLERRRTTPLK